jgi:hypothetical protein
MPVAAQENSAFERVFEGVVHEIPKHPLEQQGITSHPGRTHSHPAAQPARRGLRHEIVRHARKEISDRKIPNLRMNRGSVDFREVQQGAEQLAELASNRAYAADQMTAGVRRQFVVERRGKKLQRLHRLTQVMAGRREEAGLRRIGVLRL